MGRTPCCDKSGLKKGPWTPEEDQRLVDYIQKHGYGNWRTLPKNAGLQRCGKSCRLRWTNYLRPDIKRGRFSFEEEEIIIQLHSILGNKWSAIASRLPGRTDNEIKNYWNTHIRKRLLRMGIDPVTHTPRLDLLDLSSLYASSSPQINYNTLGGMMQVNPEILKLASSLFHHNNMGQENYLPPLIQDSMPNFSTDQFVDQSNGMSSSSSYTDWHAIDQLPSYNDYYRENLMDPPMSETSTTTFQYSNNNNNSNNIINHNNFSCFATTSVLSTPSSSNGSTSTEDERELSYVSSSNYNYNNLLMRIETPDMLDVAIDFM